jgi:hypothetical protein
MDGFLDLTRSGRTELRIHGVSGTPPESMLCHPHPKRVAGDGVAGFYRRWWPSGPPAGDDRDIEGQCRREAYSWGGLTSGTASRALWLLLLPFMLLNFAFYMTPRPSLQDRGSGLRQASAGVQRLFALTLTGSLVLSAVGVAMDLVGWQCGRLSAGCVARHGWLSFLGWGWLDTPSRQLAVTSLLPAAAVGLLWYLGRSTWSKHELTEPEARSSRVDGAAEAVLLEDRRTWNGGAAVGRLRAAHVLVGFSLVSALLLAPLAPHSGWARGLLALHLAVIAVVAVALAVLGTLAQRGKPPDQSEDGARTRSREETVARWVDRVGLAGVVLYVVTFLLAFLRQPNPGPRAAGGLPWFTGTVIWTFVTQAVLLLALLALIAAIGSSTRRLEANASPEPWANVPAHQGKAPPSTWGLAGLGTPAVAMLAWLLAGGFGAGLTLRTAGFLGAPTAAPTQPGQPRSALVVPAPYFWAAAISLVLLAAAVVAVLLVALHLKAVRRQQYARVLELEQRPHGSRQAGAAPLWAASTAPAPKPPNEREHQARLLSIAGTWARARLTDDAGRVVGSLLVFTAALLFAGCVAYGWLGPTWLPRRLNWLTTAGSFAIGLGAIGLVTLGRNAYHSPGLRRTVGIMWDLGTFWPRAVHPLAPPCYAERVIPDLLARVTSLTRERDDVVVVCAHSQGTVIAAALVLQLEPEQRCHVRLLTYGSPLQRVYARYFPAYLGERALRRIGRVLPEMEFDQVPAGTGATWSWRNLFRPSDPIGGAVFYTYDISDCDNGDVDWQLMDPVIDREAGDRAWPQAYGHSDYFRDPAFAAAYQLLAGELTPSAATKPQTDRQPSPPR